MAVLEENRRKNARLVELQVLSLSYGRVVVKPIEKQRGLVPESYEGYQILDPGDVVVRPTDLQNDQTSIRVGHVKNRGIITSAYIGLRPRGGDWIDEYAFQYLTIIDSTKRIYGMGSGLRQQLGWSDLKRMPCLVPPADEQAAIVKYLAHANARIDKAIAAKRRLIALLEEQGRATVEALIRGETEQNQTITSLPWLARVPASWELLRVKKVIEGFVQGWSPQCDAQPAGPNEWGVLKAGCSNYGRFRPEENKKLPEGLESRPELEVKHGDLLVSRANTRELVGSAAVALNPREKLIFSDKTFRLKVRSDRADGEFLALMMGARSSRDQIEAGAVGASHSMQNIGQSVIANLWVTLPPIDVQKAILDEVHRRSAEVETVVGKAGREITLLQEFRTRLIADVVTGQVDIRAIAATLPDAPQTSDNQISEPDDDLEEALSESEN